MVEWNMYIFCWLFYNKLYKFMISINFIRLADHFSSEDQKVIAFIVH